MHIVYAEYAGRCIPVNLYIAAPFQANNNAGPASALESIEVKPTFRCHILNIDLKYKQKASKSLALAPNYKWGQLFVAKKYRSNLLSPIGSNAFLFFKSVAQWPNRQEFRDPHPLYRNSSYHLPCHHT